MRSVHHKEDKLVHEIGQVEQRFWAAKREIKDILKAIKIFKGLRMIEADLAVLKTLTEKPGVGEPNQLEYTIAKVEVGSPARIF